MDRSQKIALGSIAVGFVVLAVKFAAFQLTGSAALFSDALESIVNIATAVAAAIAIRVSAQPADANHPFGHAKAEYISAVIEGVLIVIAALAILREAWSALLAPQVPEAPVLGLTISAVGTVINAIWGAILLREARRTRSPALRADGRHLFVDVVTSVGVILGVGLVALTGVAILDPILAALVALHVLWNGWAVMRDSLGGLMDEAVPADRLQRIRDTIASNADGAIEAHDIKTRSAGKVSFVDFHLVVSGAMTVSEAHDICDRLEQAIRRDVDNALVSIHVEPDNKAKHSGIVVL